MTYEPSPDLDEFLEAYEDDNNWWWRTDSGWHQVWFDAAVDRWRTAKEQLAEKDQVISDLHMQIEGMR